jgi:hypothetical protein
LLVAPSTLAGSAAITAPCSATTANGITNLYNVWPVTDNKYYCLPSAVSNPGLFLFIHDTTYNSLNGITVVTSGTSEKINFYGTSASLYSTASYYTYDGVSITLVSDGVGWWAINIF